MIPVYYFCLRYNTDSRQNAQTRPIAQYILVNIKGKNSIVLALDDAVGTTVAGSGSGQMKSSEDIQAACVEASSRGGLLQRNMKGNSVTKSCKRGKPARYNFSKKSITTNGSEGGNL